MLTPDCLRAALRCAWCENILDRLENGQPKRVASITCYPLEPLSVAKAEQQAACELFQRVEGDFDLTVDCKAILQLLDKASPPLEGPVAWGNIWRDRHRASVHWVPSHKDEAFFAARRIPEWRRLVNSDVDELCGHRSAQVFRAAVKPGIRHIDQVCEDVCLHLAKKVGFILMHKKDKNFPWLLQRSGPTSGESGFPRPLVFPNAVFVKPKSQPKPVLPNKKQRLKSLLEAQDPAMGHSWRDCQSKAQNNFAIQCTACKLYVEQCNAQDVFNRKVSNPCQDIPAEPPSCWQIHSSHAMSNKGSFFTCTKCLAVVKIAAGSSSQALQKPCAGLGRQISSGLRGQAHT